MSDIFNFDFISKSMNFDDWVAKMWLNRVKEGWMTLMTNRVDVPPKISLGCNLTGFYMYVIQSLKSTNFVVWAAKMGLNRVKWPLSLIGLSFQNANRL